MDIKTIRQEFPVLSRWAYLDNAGIAPTPSRTVEAVESFLRSYNNGEGIVRPFIGFMLDVLKEVRQECAKLLNAKEEEVIPITTSSEGSNIIANALDWQPGDNVIINDLEYPSNYYPWINLKNKGVEVRIARSREGRLSVNEIAPLVDSRTRVITATHVAYLTGFRMDLDELTEYARPRNILTVIDATQSAGAVEVDVGKNGADVIVISSLKWLLAPIGTGMLYVREAVLNKFKPAYASWLSLDDIAAIGLSEVELAPDVRRFMLSGNFDMAAYIGMVASIRWLRELGIGNIKRRVLALTRQVLEEAAAMGIKTYTPLEDRYRAGITIVPVENVGEIITSLKEAGVHAVQRANGVRLSPHFFNTEGEIKLAMDVIKRTMNK